MRGADYARIKAVEELHHDAESFSWNALVEGTKLYKTRWFKKSKNGPWQNECSCPVGENCKHAYAVLLKIQAHLEPQNTLHAESLKPIRQESQKIGTEKNIPKKADFLGWFETKTKSPAPPELHGFLQRLGNIYRDYFHDELLLRESDLHPLIPGWPRGSISDQYVSLWPEPPLSQESFFYFLLEALQRKVGSLPPGYAMLPPPPPKIAKAIEDFHLQEEADEWDDIIRRRESLKSKNRSFRHLDFRFVLGAEGLAIEHRMGGQDFTELSLTQLLKWVRQSDIEVQPSSAPSNLVWQSILAYYQRTSSSSRIQIDDPLADTLAFLLNTAGFQDRVVRPDGQPHERADHPLNWELLEDETHYLIQLMWDGVPFKEAFILVASEPAWVVTDQFLYPAPPAADRLGLGRSMRIPRTLFSDNRKITWLLQFQISPPASLTKGIEFCQARPVLRCRIGESTETRRECLIIEAVACEKKKTMALYEGGEWVMAELSKKKKGVSLQLDHASLRPLEDALDALGIEWYSHQNAWVLEINRRFPEFFTAWAQYWRDHVEMELDRELSGLLSQPIQAKLETRLDATGQDWFDLAAIISTDDLTLTREELKALLKAKGGYVRLAGKGWKRLEFKLNQEDEEHLALLGLDAGELDGRKHRVHALQLNDAAKSGALPEHFARTILDRCREIQTKVQAEIPSGITATLRPYQIDGFRFLAYLSNNQFGGLLADDMGLGKTLQTLTWLLWLREKEGARASLVVCPKSVVDVWESEVKRFAPELPVRVMARKDPNAVREAIESKALLVCNYAQLRLRSDELLPVTWQATILDEAQAIKNPGSQTAQLAKMLNSTHRVALSGTPVENRLLDVWSLMSYAMPGILGTKKAFSGKFDGDSNPLAARRLGVRLRPFFLRRNKQQVASDLPPRIEEDLYCELEGSQQTLYQAELKRAQQHLLKIQTSKQFEQQRFHLLTSLLRLRQICCHPGLAVEDQKKAGSAKVEMLLEHLDTVLEEGNKVLIFSQWVEMLEILDEALKEHQSASFLLTGKTENRSALVESFQNHQGPATFLISLKAGGSGLNLTAASYVYLFDPWWNPAVEAQAIDRTHRIGQKQTVFAYRMLTRNTIEEKIRKLQSMKKQLATDVIGDGGFNEALTLDDFRYLLDS